MPTLGDDTDQIIQEYFNAVRLQRQADELIEKEKVMKGDYLDKKQKTKESQSTRGNRVQKVSKFSKFQIDIEPSKMYLGHKILNDRNVTPELRFYSGFATLKTLTKFTQKEFYNDVIKGLNESTLVSNTKKFKVDFKKKVKDDLLTFIIDFIRREGSEEALGKLYLVEKMHTAIQAATCPYANAKDVIKNRKKKGNKRRASPLTQQFPPDSTLEVENWRTTTSSVTGRIWGTIA